MPKTNIAILGLGTVGYGVYDIVQKIDSLNIAVKYVLDKDTSKKELLDKNTILTSNYDDIINDNEVEIIVETMGAKDFSYYCIKKALENNKSVVTANKEVIANSIDELTELKIKNKVSLMYEASVGGGIPIIAPLFEIVKVNEVDEVYGILNGTTNFILTKMTNEKMEFSDALKLAQKLGFAEADPTADLEGLDMVRKIAILSDIAYHGKVNIENIEHYGISTVSAKDISFVDSKDYVIKLLAYSKLDEKASILIEPVIVKKDHILAAVQNENNIVSVNAAFNDNLKFYGKGAGRYPTANAIVNDLIAITEGRKNYTFDNQKQIEVCELNKLHQYYLRLNEQINSELILESDSEFVITKPISRKQLKDIKDKVAFYARIL